MDTDRNINLTFAEVFSILVIIGSIVAFFIGDEFNSRYLKNIFLYFCLVSIVSLVSIIFFKFKLSVSLFVVILLLFSVFYPFDRYGHKDEIDRVSKKFTAFITSEVKYINGKLRFEGILIPDSSNNGFYAIKSKAQFYTTVNNSEIIRGTIIEGRGKATLLDSKASDYNLYLFSRGIDYVVDISDMEMIGFNRPKAFYELVSRFKRYIEGVCSRLLPYPHSTFIIALLTGNRRYIPLYLIDIFKRVGTLHILAISGLHVGFLAGIFLIIFRLVGLRHVYLYLTVATFIILYALFIGNSPSVKRASMMFVMGVLLYILDRDRNYVNLLAIVFLILLLRNPRAIFNPGFLLSFFATFGIIYFSPIIKKLSDIFLPPILSLLISMSLAASFYTFPIMIEYFNSFSYISVIANVAIIPLAALILILSILMIAVYPIFLPLANIIAHVNSFFISLLFSINIGFSYIPPITLKFNFLNNMGSFIYFSIVTFLIYYFAKRKKRVKIFGG